MNPVKRYPPQAGKKALAPPKLFSAFAGVIVLLSVFAYSQSLQAPFVFDDIYQIVENEDIQLTRLTWDQIKQASTKITAQRPLAGISFALNYYFNGLDPLFYHIVNLMIHILTALFLLKLLLTTLYLTSEKCAPSAAQCQSIEQCADT